APAVGAGGAAAHREADILGPVAERAAPHRLAVGADPDRQFRQRARRAQAQEHVVKAALVGPEAEHDLAAALAQPGAPVFRLAPAAEGAQFLAAQKALLLQRLVEEVAAPGVDDLGQEIVAEAPFRLAPEPSEADLSRVGDRAIRIGLAPRGARRRLAG